MKTYIIIGLLIILGGAVLVFNAQNKFELPKGTTEPFVEEENNQEKTDNNVTTNENEKTISMNEETEVSRTSEREVLITDGRKHSVPLNQILSGGPAKDGIPSIDNPKFINTKDADSFLEDKDVGLGLTVNGESRFYPYQILVFHEIVNDTISDQPVLVTYCPLCATGVVFDRRVQGEVEEFGVSGLLWQSNLLMYNRAPTEELESLWSQVLGEAVLGENTGEKLKIIRSDTTLYGDWKDKNPNTKVLSKETGAIRSYGNDPYGSYYSSELVSYGATFNDDRLHPKAFVLGVEVDGKFKAYHLDALQVGDTEDIFEGKTITINKTDTDSVSMSIGSAELPYIGGFWFSWLAVHSNTELFK